MWNVGYSYQNLNTLDIGLRRTSNESDSNIGDGQWMMRYFLYPYSILGTEINFQSDKISLSPKIGFGYHFLFVNANLNFVGYNDGIHINPTFVPEIGYSFFGVYQINYGYNLFMNNNDLFGLGRNKISFRFSFFINSKGWKLKDLKSI